MLKHPLPLVMLIVAALYAAALDHGMPHRFVPDDSAVKAALGIAQRMKEEGPLVERLVPPSGTYTTYPYLLPYAHLGAIGARFAVGRVTGEWGSANQFADVLYDDASLAWLPARIVNALLGLLLPLAVYRAARELRQGRGTAGLAALFAGTSLLVVQYAHTSRPWVPMVAFGAAALALSLRLRRKRTVGAGVAAWSAAALAASCHPLGLLSFGYPLVGTLCAARRSLGAWFVGPLVAVVLTAGVGYPYALVYGEDAGAGSISEESGGAASDGIQIGGQAFDPTWFEGGRLADVGASWFGYEPALLLLGLVGLFALARSAGDATRQAWWLVVVPTLGFAATFLLYEGTHVRYLMPTTAGLALGAGALAARLWGQGGWRRIVVAALVVLPLAQAARFDQLLMQTDTRVEAAREVVALTQPDDVIAVDHHGSYYAPPLRPSGASLAPLESAVDLTGRERRWLDWHRAEVADPPDARAIVPITRFYVFDSYYPTDYVLGTRERAFADVLDDWDVTVYVQVDRMPDDARRQPITDEMARRGTLIYALSPTDVSPPGEAALPTDMAFALTDLWTYTRPGPWIRVWRLGDAR